MSLKFVVKIESEKEFDELKRCVHENLYMGKGAPSDYLENLTHSPSYMRIMSSLDEEHLLGINFAIEGNTINKVGYCGLDWYKEFSSRYGEIITLKEFCKRYSTMNMKNFVDLGIGQ